MNNTQDGGDCFVQNCKEFIYNIKDDTARLVHGIVINTLDGLPMSHCWIEYDKIFDESGNAKLPMVIDRSNGNNADLPKVIYYNAGNCEKVAEYTRDEAFKMINTHQHWGPWVDIDAR